MRYGLMTMLSSVATLALSGATVVESVRTREIRACDGDAELYYDFSDMPRGRIVQDRSGNSHDGIATGCGWSATGRFAGGASMFHGDGSRIEVDDDLDFSSWPQYSVSIWFMHDGNGEKGPQYGHKLVDKSQPFHDWQLSLQPVGHDTDNGAVTLRLNEGLRQLSLSDATRNYGDGGWHHVVVVRDGDSGELWLDGECCAATNGMFSVYAATATCVGNSNSTDHYQRRGWSGELDELRIFRRRLDGAEITGLYQSGVTDPARGEVRVAADLKVQGKLEVAGTAVFEGGVRLSAPAGDLAWGRYGNDGGDDE